MLLINSSLLNEILKTIFLKRDTNFIFHLIHFTEEGSGNLIFQVNYNNSFYTSYTIKTDLLLYFDSLEFENNSFVLNYEQCEKLIELTELFKNIGVSFKFNENKGSLEVIISHTNIKLEFPIPIDPNPIIPPDKNMYKIVDYISIETNLFLNVVKLVHDKKYYTQIELDPIKNRLILGEEDSFKTTLKLNRELILEPTTIFINPDSIILFLENVKKEKIGIKIHESLAFVINFETEFGIVYYYRAHETE